MAINRSCSKRSAGPRSVISHAGRVFLIFDQGIRDAQRERVHGAADDDPELLVAKSAQVLNGGQQTGLQHRDAHPWSSGQACISAVEIARKRTVSPGSKRLGGFSEGRKSTSGVQPINCHPPGVLTG